MSAPANKYKVLIILFPGFNTLDVNGPYEILRKSGTSTFFDVSVASETDITTSGEGVRIQRDLPLNEELIRGCRNFDILIVPGGAASGPTSPVEVQANKLNGPFMSLIAEFSKRAPAYEEEQRVHPRVLLSICTGALFLGNLGIFNNRFCTTHWAAYSNLTTKVKEAAVRTQGIEGRVIPARFVDPGVSDDGVHLISSGGISCGMDAALHVVKLLAGEQEAAATAQLLDYSYRKTEGVVFGPDNAALKGGN